MGRIGEALLEAVEVRVHLGVGRRGHVLQPVGVFAHLRAQGAAEVPSPHLQPLDAEHAQAHDGVRRVLDPLPEDVVGNGHSKADMRGVCLPGSPAP